MLDCIMARVFTFSKSNLFGPAYFRPPYKEKTNDFLINMGVGL